MTPPLPDDGYCPEFAALNRRSVLRGALALGGATFMVGSATVSASASSPTPASSVLVVLSLRGNSRSLRVGGITLLFVALGKLFLYDLAFLTAMARAVSFIVTGSVLLLAALLLQRFAPQVKAALGDEPPEALA